MVRRQIQLYVIDSFDYLASALASSMFAGPISVLHDAHKIWYPYFDAFLLEVRQPAKYTPHHPWLSRV